jgi:predicted phage tail protein
MYRKMSLCRILALSLSKRNHNRITSISTSIMKIGAKSFSLFLLASQDVVLSSSAFRPLALSTVAASSTVRGTSSSSRTSTSITMGGNDSNQLQCLAKATSSSTSTTAAMYSSLLNSRGGSINTSTSTALNSAVASEESTAPTEIFRNDYEPLAHVVSKINMDFQIGEGATTVTSELFLKPNSNYNGKSQDLVLDGDETNIKLMSLTLNGKALKEGADYELTPGKLVVKNPPPESVLTTVVEIVPEDNTQLSGLYKSGPMYCTQCEAQGFRRITYYPDRPDNMAVFESVRLEADKDSYPILLANGNLLEEGDADNGRHYAVWSDPFPKPSYLFCCVAGSLGNIKDSFTTLSGREVTLQLFSEAHNVHKLDYAMESLKRSMKWDEDKYGLEYDLDLYNIVAVDSFNMGAMENKVGRKVCWLQRQPHTLLTLTVTLIY